MLPAQESVGDILLLLKTTDRTSLISKDSVTSAQERRDSRRQPVLAVAVTCPQQTANMTSLNIRVTQTSALIKMPQRCKIHKNVKTSLSMCH